MQYEAKIEKRVFFETGTTAKIEISIWKISEDLYQVRIVEGNGNIVVFDDLLHIQANKVFKEQIIGFLNAA